MLTRKHLQCYEHLQVYSVDAGSKHKELRHCDSFATRDRPVEGSRPRCISGVDNRGAPMTRKQVY